MNNGRISLSVVIPVYNTAKWIGECLDSILAQKVFDLEVICVNDGSTDESPEILKAYAEKDSRVRVFTQENRGISATRNRGIDAARGEYLWFFDSDDTINPEMLDTVYQAVVSGEKPQMVCFSKNNKFYDRDYTGPRNLYKRRKKKKSSASYPEGLQTGPETMQLLIKAGKGWHWVWTYLIRRDFIKENRLYFTERIYRHEDAEFMARAYRDAVSVLFVSEVIVNHRIREGSSIDSVLRKTTEKDVKVLFESVISIYKTYSESIILQQKAPLLARWLMRPLLRCQQYYRRFIQENPEGIIPFTDEHEKMLFDLLICYPVETGRSLLALREAEKKIKSVKYRIFSRLPESLKKPIRKMMRRR